jgi:hypothetical protein
MVECSAISRSSALRARPCGGLLLAALVLSLGLASSPASAESFSKCRQMSRQIAQFIEVEHRAESRGNDLWAQSTKRHIRHLEERQLRACPRYLASIEETKVKKAVEETKRIIVAAGKAAARYFTFGF